MSAPFDAAMRAAHANWLLGQSLNSLNEILGLDHSQLESFTDKLFKITASAFKDQVTHQDSAPSTP